MPRFPRLVLAVGGAGMLAAGAAGIILGLAAPGWLRGSLPRVVVDQAAVGGAAVALGVLVAGAGVVQLLLVVASGRAGRWVAAAASIVAGLCAALAFAFAAVLATETATGGPPWLLAASGACLLVGLSYGAGALGAARASV